MTRLVGDAETVERTFIHDIIQRVFPGGALALLPFAVTILDSKTLQPSPNKTILRDPHMRLYFNVCIDLEMSVVILATPFCMNTNDIPENCEIFASMSTESYVDNRPCDSYV